MATHYCFIDLFDAEQSFRASIETIFSSITFELLERDPSVTPSGPRYAAGPQELEKLLEDGSKAKPNRRIAIIVDGLDHADRISGAPTARLATEIADELAGISLPPWSEYMDGYEVQKCSSNTSYGNESDSAISISLLTGHLRLVGKQEAIRVCSEWLCSPSEPPFYARDIAWASPPF